jgi:2-amino-4-hydroxy-6-hydroxymethyldihydropteridine diphosphokinase
LYETEPVGGPEQGPFLNAVMVVSTDLDPLDLLDRLQAVEHEHGRDRKQHWGPRTLDLDIVATDGPRVSEPRLVVPHPRAHEREFVVRPLTDIWPEAEVGPGLTAAASLEVLGDQGVDLLARDWIRPATPWKGRALVAGQIVLVLAVALALAADGSLPQGEVTLPRVVGASMAVFGVILAFVASRRLGAALTVNPVPRPNAALAVSGPYRYARHPIYGGVCLVMMGTALVLDSTPGLLIAALLVPYFLFKASFEERQLRMRFADYKRYRDVVHRRLIPFVI